MKSTELCFGIDASTCTDKANFKNIQKTIPENKNQKKIPRGMVVENYHSVTVSVMRSRSHMGLCSPYNS